MIQVAPGFGSRQRSRLRDISDARHDRQCEDGVGDAASPLEGTAERIAEGLQGLAEAGADEAILVVSPINERSIRTLGEARAAL